MESQKSAVAVAVAVVVLLVDAPRLLKSGKWGKKAASLSELLFLLLHLRK